MLLAGLEANNHPPSSNIRYCHLTNHPSVPPSLTVTLWTLEVIHHSFLRGTMSNNNSNPQISPWWVNLRSTTFVTFVAWDESYVISWHLSLNCPSEWSAWFWKNLQLCCPLVSHSINISWCPEFLIVSCCKCSFEVTNQSLSGSTGESGTRFPWTSHWWNVWVVELNWLWLCTVVSLPKA